MSGQFSIPPDAQARMSMLSKLHDGSKNASCETGLRNVLDLVEIDAELNLGANHVAADELSTESYTDSAKTSDRSRC